jgi:DNA-binding transcriptional ArsR family regulator
MKLLWKRSEMVDICRTLASQPRLTILDRIVGKGEANAAHIAEDTELAGPTVSQHVRRLVRAGLVRDLDAGTGYKLEWPDDKDGLGGEVRDWIYPLLKDPVAEIRMLKSRQRPKDWRDDPRQAIHDMVYEIVTGFANSRRIEIFHQIDGCSGISPPYLAAELQIPRESVSWHAGKLLRRGLITLSGTKKRQALSVPKTLPSPMHTDFLGIIRTQR